MSLTGSEREDLRRDLLDLGFDEVRFADASPMPPNRLEDWLDRGWQADMDWMDRTAKKRQDPGRVLPGAQTVVLFGVNYLPGDLEAATQERWAKYSLHEDYHDTMIKAVRAAADLVAGRFGLEADGCRGYVDTGPVLERGLAARSGLGWQGKNGVLISRRHGNWLFLGALLTRARIDPDAPLPEGTATRATPPSLGRYCGSCTRCLEACPTNAIREPGLVDSRRCISYLTIEHKGVIPREYRSAIGSRIFGCDICLDVCPWNRFARAGRSLLLVARHDLAGLTLLDLLKLTPEGFAEIFRRTPFKRLKRERLLRNACVVAGNIDAEADWRDHLGGARDQLLARLVELAESATPLVRVHAVWAVHRLEPQHADHLLADARASEKDAAVLHEYAGWE